MTACLPSSRSRSLRRRYVVLSLVTGVGSCHCAATTTAVDFAQSETPRTSTKLRAHRPRPRERTTERIFGLVVHGGAGTVERDKMKPAQEQRSRATLERALDAGYAVLESGGRSVAAVERTLVILEDSPLFNAGKGSVLTHGGTMELDAAIMDGATGEAGAIAGVRGVKNPIRGAIAVMQRSRMCCWSRREPRRSAANMGSTSVCPAIF